MAQGAPGPWFRRQRIAAGYEKQESLAHALGYRSHGAISNWERGEGSPDPAIVPKLASLLNVSAQEIVDRFQIKMPGEIPDAPMPPWAREIISRLDRLERPASPPEPAPRANIAPLPTVRKRRAHWLKLARERRGWNIVDVDREMGHTRPTYGRWENGEADPRGAQVRRLAEALDIPEGAITEPPPTDEERLAAWHFADGDGERLRRVV